ncbi:MAG: carbohydrate-binding protein, partial [Verrucomicrobiota bacterium]
SLASRLKFESETVRVSLPLIVFFVGLAPDGAGSENAKSSPFGGKPQAIPGTIEAEHYDEGPAGVAYHDVEAKNLGADYRKETQVDIEKRDDASNGHGIGWTRKGEWLKYTVQVAKDGIYDIEMPVASNKKGGSFHLEIDGKDITGPIGIPDTGAWTTLKTITHKGIEMKRGVHIIRVVMDKEGPSGSIGDIDYFKFTEAK